jgi:hypothetical protein
LLMQTRMYAKKYGDSSTSISLLSYLPSTRTKFDKSSIFTRRTTPAST